MVTYTIGGSGGAICRGIPSLDAAIAVLGDMVRYEDACSCFPWECKCAGGNLRTAREVVFDYIEDKLGKYWHVPDRHGRTDMVISEERRCDHCHQLDSRPLRK